MRFERFIIKPPIVEASSSGKSHEYALFKSLIFTKPSTYITIFMLNYM